jgi:hypothetical protein
MRIAIDTGGTFTDCVYFQDGRLQVLKVFSTPSDPGQAVLEALRRIGAQGEVLVRHGTTVGTNAMIERKGARVAFVTTAGFEDTIAIGRQARARLYDWFQPAPDCLAPEHLRFGIEERVSAEGEGAAGAHSRQTCAGSQSASEPPTLRPLPFPCSSLFPILSMSRQWPRRWRRSACPSPSPIVFCRSSVNMNGLRP